MFYIDSPERPSSKKRRTNTTEVADSTPHSVVLPVKKAHSLAFINTSLIEANAASGLALQRLRNSNGEIGKNRFKNACRNALRAVEALIAPSVTSSTSSANSFKVSEFEPQMRTFFSDLCEIVRLTYLKMELSGKWDVSRPGVPFQARGAVEKLYEMVALATQSKSVQRDASSSSLEAVVRDTSLSDQFRDRVSEAYEKYDCFLMDIALRFEVGDNATSTWYAHSSLFRIVLCSISRILEDILSITLSPGT